MHGRLIAVIVPLIIATSAVLGALVMVEGARRISLDAHVAANGDLISAAELLDRSGVDGDLATVVAPFAHPDRLIEIRSTGARSVTVGSASVDRLRTAGGSIGSTETVWPWSEGTIERSTTISLDDGSLDVVFIDSVEPIKASVSRQWAVIGGAVVTLAAVVAAATFPLTRRTVRPIAELNSTATSLASGDLDARADVGDAAPELRQLGESINRMAETVASGVQRERSFVASASHHFGNLLTPLRLRIETLDRTDHQVEEALAELDRLETTAERLLLLTRAEERDAQPIAHDVADAVDETVRSWRVVTDRKNIELVRAGSTSASAWAVPGAVEEVLDNLIDNAVKYGERSTITVSVLRGLHNVRIMVSDGGPGMSDHDIERAMGRFWRGATQQGKPGSGLGLAIADALATRCGGRLEVRTPPSGGLESTLVLERVG